VLMMILRETALLAVSGIVIGIGAAAGATRYIGRHVIWLRAIRSAEFGAAVLLLLAIALLAGWWPARKAVSARSDGCTAPRITKIEPTAVRQAASNPHARRPARSSFLAIASSRRIPASRSPPSFRSHSASAPPPPFSVIYGLLVNPFPYSGAARMINLTVLNENGNNWWVSLTGPQLRALKDAKCIESLAASQGTWNLTTTTRSARRCALGVAHRKFGRLFRRSRAIGPHR